MVDEVRSIDQSKSKIKLTDLSIGAKPSIVPQGVCSQFKRLKQMFQNKKK